MALETGQLVDRHRALAIATPVLRRDLVRTRSVAHNNMIMGANSTLRTYSILTFFMVL